MQEITFCLTTTEGGSIVIISCPLKGNRGSERRSNIPTATQRETNHTARAPTTKHAALRYALRRCQRPCWNPGNTGRETGLGNSVLIL